MQPFDRYHFENVIREKRIKAMDRSEIMRRVRGKDTLPEMKVRRLLHGLGCRYRLHRKDLPGKPDIVFPGKRAVIFVHGCFWHGHYCKHGSRTPKTNVDYWKDKIRRNVERDTEHLSNLDSSGWRVFVVWECETTNEEGLRRKLVTFLNGEKEDISGATQ